MTKFEKILNGMMFIRSYGPKCELQPGHDEIYIYPPEGTEVSEDAKLHMANLDWDWDDQFDGWRMFT